MIQFFTQVPMRSILLALALSFSPATAIGMTFSTELPDLLGSVEFLPSTGFRDASFDFGQQFSEIESVSIEIEAHVSARQLDFCGTFLNPTPCVPVVQLLGFFVRLDTEGLPFFSGQVSGGLSFGDFRDLEGYGIDVAAFSDRSIQSNFEYLLDGRGNLTLFWNEILGNPDRIFINPVQPIGDIIGARLIIVGTPIPEPSTALLLGIGLVVLSGKNRHTN